MLVFYLVLFNVVMSVKPAYSIWTFLVLDLLGIHAIKQIHPAMQLVSTTTAGGICDRILYIEPMHKICIENRKGEKKKKNLHISKPGSLQTDVKKTWSYNGKY